MEAKFIIPGRLACLNDLIKAAKSNRFRYSDLKREMTAVAAKCVVSGRVPVFKNPIALDILYIEPNAKRDIDGVFAGGMKFILDALGPTEHGGTGRIPNDTRFWVREVRNSAPLTDAQNPRIEVRIREVLPVGPC